MNNNIVQDDKHRPVPTKKTFRREALIFIAVILLMTTIKMFFFTPAEDLNKFEGIYSTLLYSLPVILGVIWTSQAAQAILRPGSFHNQQQQQYYINPDRPQTITNPNTGQTETRAERLARLKALRKSQGR